MGKSNYTVLSIWVPWPKLDIKQLLSGKGVQPLTFIPLFLITINQTMDAPCLLDVEFSGQFCFAVPQCQHHGSQKLWQMSIFNLSCKQILTIYSIQFVSHISPCLPLCMSVKIYSFIRSVRGIIHSQQLVQRSTSLLAEQLTTNLKQPHCSKHLTGENRQLPSIGLELTCKLQFSSTLNMLKSNCMHPHSSQDSIRH